MSKARIYVASALLAWAVGFSSASSAGNMFSLGSDTMFTGSFTHANWSKEYGIQSREGVAGGADWETGIVNADGSATYAQGQADWTQSSSHTFDWGMDSASLVTHSTNLAPPTEPISATVSGGTSANTIIIRAAARTEGPDDGMVETTLSDLILLVGGNPVDLMGNTTLVGDLDAEYIAITGLDLSNGFSLSGTADFGVGAMQTGNSRVLYEVKVGNYSGQVPVPGTAWLFAAAVLGLAARRRLQSAR